MSVPHGTMALDHGMANLKACLDCPARAYGILPNCSISPTTFVLFALIVRLAVSVVTPQRVCVSGARFKTKVSRVEGIFLMEDQCFCYQCHSTSDVDGRRAQRFILTPQTA